MGNLLSGFYNRGNIENQEGGEETEFSYTDLDSYSVIELIEFIKEIKGKKLDVNENFSKLTRGIELETMNLIPMSIEYFEKIKDVVPEYVPEKNSYNRSYRYIKPRFTKERAEKKGEEVVTTATNDFPLDLDPIPKPSNPFNDKAITLQEFESSFGSTMTNSDMIGISKKMLEFSNNYHKGRFINCYNKLYRGEISPSTVSFGKAGYVYKEGKKGPKDDIDSFRQIMAIPNPVSHFHRILAIRVSDFLKENQFIDTNIQKGAIPGIKYGVLEQVHKVKEVIKDANTNKKGLVVMFLDITNAFGSIDREKMFTIMGKYGISDNLITYIRDYYNNLLYYAKTRDWSTKVMKFERGVIQGCPLSPVLFVLALNYILTHLDNKFKEQVGYEIKDGVKMLLTAFIDDLCIVGTDTIGVKKVYDRLKLLLGSLGMSFSVRKSAIMEINQKEDDLGIDIDGMPRVNVYKYLGEYLSKDGTVTESYSDFISNLGKKLYALERKNIDKETKLKFFTKCLMPWINRKMLIMYDLTKQQKINIVSLIKKYVTKWGNTDELSIFTFVADIFSHSNDEIISKLDPVEQDTDINSELARSINTNTSGIKLTYDSINKEPEVD